MAGTITHLAIADRICERLGDEFFMDLPLFYLGNIAPDAVHARENYVREYKKCTHLTEGISGSEFCNLEKLALFHDRLRAFINKNYRVELLLSDLYLGYIVHLVTDELFNIHMRKHYVELMETKGIKDTDQEFFRSLMRDIDGIDYLILNNFSFKHDIKSMLQCTNGYEVKDMISAEEATKSKKWVIDKYWGGGCKKVKNSNFCYDDAVRFIGNTTEAIVYRFTNDSSFPSLFVRE